MGHERIGFLPKTKQWKNIVEQLSLYDGDSSSAMQIANNTLLCIQSSYKQMPYDESVTKAIKFLTLLSVSAQQKDQVGFLNENGCIVDTNLSLFSLLNSARNYITTENGSLENNKLVKDSVLQAISVYQKEHSQEQLTFFDNKNGSMWSEIGTGAAFCELSRSFFAAFTDRQIKYYVERSAASEISDLNKLNSFISVLSNHSDLVSHHAFETSKIMQSFAAGWFNKNAKNDMPSDSQVSDLLKVSFRKMQEEFRREAEQE